MEICDSYGWDYIFTFKEGRTPRAYADAQELMAADPGNSATLVRHDAKGRRVECGVVAWAIGVEIARGSGDWYVFNVLKVEVGGHPSSEADRQRDAPLAGRAAAQVHLTGIPDGVTRERR